MTENTTSENSLPEDDQLVSCEVCLKSVPASEADIVEANDYVAYFCGLECYDIWRNKEKQSDSA